MRIPGAVGLVGLVAGVLCAAFSAPLTGSAAGDPQTPRRAVSTAGSQRSAQPTGKRSKTPQRGSKSGTASPTSFDPPVPMARYWFGILRRGPAWTPEHSEGGDSIQTGHMANIQRMFDEGVLVASGPLIDGGNLRGVFVFRADSVAQVMPLIQRDPAIASHRLVLDVDSWFAPAGIGDLYRARTKQPGHRDSMVTYTLALAKRGPKFMQEITPELIDLQQRHVANLFALLLSGRAAAAGPLNGRGENLGVFVMRGDSLTAASILSRDPAIHAGFIGTELHPWMTAWGTFPGDTL